MSDYFDLGATGPEVDEMHQQLASLGYDVGPTYEYDDYTANALRSFQQDCLGAEATGVADADTLAQLRAYTGYETSGSASAEYYEAGTTSDQWTDGGQDWLYGSTGSGYEEVDTSSGYEAKVLIDNSAEIAEYEKEGGEWGQAIGTDVGKAIGFGEKTFGKAGEYAGEAIGEDVGHIAEGDTYAEIGAGVGAVAGAVTGMVAGPTGAIAGHEAGEWLGETVGEWIDEAVSDE